MALAKVRGVLHDPVSGSSRKVEAELDAVELRLAGGPRVPLSRVEASAGGWQAQAVHLSWQDDAGQRWTLSFEDPASLADLGETLPEAIASVLGTARQAEHRTRRSGRFAIALLAACVALPLVALALLFAFREPILDGVVARLPHSVDQKLGTLTAEQVEASGQLVKQGPAVDAVRAIGERLLRAAPEQPFEFRFAVMKDGSLNAFAAPGGFVVVHTGLLAAAESPDEAAGVLGHEIAHVLRRHSLRQLAFDLGLTALIQLVIGTPDGAVAVLAGSGQQLSGLSFSREQESEADQLGLDLLRRARLPGQGLPAFFDRLAKQGGAGVPAFLSSHPASDERREAMRAELARRGDWPVEPLALDWAAVQMASGHSTR